jgi:MFS transporter, MHS family, citrate/tricarballylate:H+ symporter
VGAILGVIVAGQTVEQRRLARRAVIAATTGNALEFYDFITFSFFAIQIGKVFFPSEDPFVSLMASLATFGIGFIGRPLGAWAIGAWADRHGRKPAMLLSMTLMGLSVAVLALTPSYAAIGIAAPVIVVVARLLQGFALGGEVGSATTYMLECASEQRRAWSISWQGASQAIASSAGSLVGLGLSLVLTPEQLTDWGWRVALLLGTVIVPFSILIRRSLPETIHAPDHLPAGHLPARVWRTIILGAMMISGATIATYLFNYMATYGQNTLHFSASVSLGTTLAVNVARFFSILLGGWLSDRLGRRMLMIWPSTVFAASIVPAYVWLTSAHDPAVFIVVNALLAFISTMPSGAIYAAIAESLPKANRARTFALIYALPVTFLGGTTQLVITWLLKVTGDPMAVAWYMAGSAGVALVAMFLMHESAPARLKPVAA